MLTTRMAGDALLWLLAPAAAQQPTPSDASPPPTAAIVIDRTLSSKTSRIGDVFPIRLAAPVLTPDGSVAIPTGATGQGEVIHAAKAGGAGRAGELIVAARFVECQGRRVRLGHLHLAATGHDGSGPVGAANAAMAGASALSPFVGAGVLLAFAIKGGEIVLPAGTSGIATVTDLAALAACGDGAAGPFQSREEP